MLRLCGPKVILFVLLWAGVPVQAQEWLYTVQPGDTLSGISAEYLQSVGRWQDLQSLNNITDPGRLPPGLVLRVPLEWLKVQPAPVKVVHVLGEASAVHPDGRAEELNAGMVLTMGDEARTGARAAVTLEFADGSQLLMRANSRLMLDTVRAYGKTGMVDTRVRQLSGRSETKVKPKRGAGDRFELETPAGISAVRGTEFRVDMDAETGLARTEVAEGVVAVSGAEVTHEVPAGFGVLTKAGEAPSLPVALLPAPALADISAVQEALPLVVGFTPVAGAVAYRVHVSIADSPLIVVYDQKISNAKVSVPALVDGSYVLHVRTIDAQGLEGLDADRAFVLHARPVQTREIRWWPAAVLLLIGGLMVL